MELKMKRMVAIAEKKIPKTQANKEILDTTESPMYIEKLRHKTLCIMYICRLISK